MHRIATMLAAVLLAAPLASAEEASTARPNFLWISLEDISPDLGCYGDAYAITPNIDALAAQGVRYTNAFTHAGVCAPSRSGIITGMYPCSIGTHPMRCKGVPPPEVKCFTEYLRAAGYYCTNNSKTDYQFDAPDTAWDESSGQAHWRNRAEGQPFFAVMNLTSTHESRIRQPQAAFERLRAEMSPDEIHDPAEAPLPPYHPDTPIVRQDWANYADNLTWTDKRVGEILRQLADDGLADNTIVWFWGDHGRGLPRGKRWIYDSGIRVPLIVRVPEPLRDVARPGAAAAMLPGTASDDLVAAVDFAPTMLSLAGVELPGHLQGQAFLGAQRGAPRQYVFAHRDRMDESYDFIRAVRDKRFKYIRNFMPYVPLGQDIAYMNEMPTMQEMRRLHAADELTEAQQHYFRVPKPVEELYDTAADPHEVHNLAAEPEYQEVLHRMRGVLAEWQAETRDIGFIPEPEFDAMKRPGEEYAVTAPPRAPVARAQNAERVTLQCDTPGASIAYAIGRAKPRRWQLYGEPFDLEPGATLWAKACRIGYRDSEIIRVVGGDTGSHAAADDATADGIHWSQQVAESGMLPRLRKLKSYDLAPADHIDEHIAALDDPAGSVRYWAVVGLHRLCGEAARTKKTERRFVQLLADDASCVRIAAAQALCDWDHHTEAALDVLTTELRGQQPATRMFAATALGQIGEQARPALDALRAAMKDQETYVRNITHYTLQRLVGPSQR